MVNGILSPHESTVIVSLTDPNSDKPLSRIADLFTQNFREDTSRVRAIFALRTLLGLELTQSGVSSLPTSPETIAMLYLLHVAATTDTNTKSSVGESKDFAGAALYEHLLRVEDLLRDDSLLYEQRKYRATAAVGGNKGKDQARDAIEKDAFRGHLLQKVFVLHCAIKNSNNNSNSSSSLLVDDLSQTVSALCASTNTACTLESLENTVAAWSTDAALKTTVSDTLAHLKKCYDREVLQHSSSTNVAGSPQGNNFMASYGYFNRAVPMPSTESNPVNTANGFLNTGYALTQAKKGSKHYYTSGELATPFSSDIALTPITAIVNPPRGRVAVDARLLLPPSNPLLLDSTAHPQDWREAKSIIDAAINGASELTAQQLTKLTSILLDSDSGSNTNGGKGGKNNNNNNNKKVQNKDSTSNNNSDVFPFLGLTPAAFAKISRSNPKAAVIIVQKFAAIVSSSGTGAASIAEPYLQQIVEFNHSTNPDYCPTVVAAAAKHGLITSSQVSTYVTRAKAYSIACGGAKERNDFLKAFFTALHQTINGASDKSILDATDKVVAGTLLNGVSELSEVAKLWSS